MDLSQFTITGEHDRVNLLKTQNAKLIKLRWFYLSVLPGVAAISNSIAGHQDKVKQYMIIGLIGLTLNGLLYLFNRFALRSRNMGYFLMMLQLTLDLTVASVTTYTQGGADARTTALYALPIVATGLIFSRFFVYLVAIMSSISYAGVLILHNTTKDVPITVSEMLVPVVFYPVFYLILARLVVYLTGAYVEDAREKAYDSFLALLSHQLKHPVSTASAIIDQLEHNHLKSAPKDKKYIMMLKSENRNLLLLLNNLLETAAPQSYVSRYDEVDLPKMLQEVGYHCAETYGRVSDFKYESDDMSLMVPGVGERLKTAIANVLNNAFRYSKNGTNVVMRLEKTSANVIITIEDKGTSLNTKAKAALFKKYNINRDAEHGVEGLGLGLYVARKIIADHQGSLNIISDKAGTKVIITLKRGGNDE
jgi:signal transduction histidine kinase